MAYHGPYVSDSTWPVGHVTTDSDGSTWERTATGWKQLSKGRGSFTVPAALAPTIAKINENYERQRERMQRDIETPVFGDALHDDHGPCAPLGPLEAAPMRWLRDVPGGAPMHAVSNHNPYGDDPPRVADLRDEKIEALTTLVTEMGVIITEQSAQMHTLGRRIEVLADRLSAVEARPTTRNPNLDAAERRLMDDPTMRAMSSLRAKGLG